MSFLLSNQIFLSKTFYFFRDALLYITNDFLHFSVEAFVREEISNMDSSELFLDIFVNDDYNHFVDYKMLFNHEGDAASQYKQPSSVVQPLPSTDFMLKSRYTRFVLDLLMLYEVS